MASKRIANVELDPRGFSTEQKERIGRRLDEVMPTQPACEMCGKKVWSINDRLVTPIMLYAEPDSDTFAADFGIIHPSIFLQCTHCGNSKIISLGVLGIDPTEEKE